MNNAMRIDREPTEEEKRTYWYKAYVSMERAALEAQRRVKDLEAILQAQVNSNDKLGSRMKEQDGLMQERFDDHNTETQQMAQEIMRLRQKVKALGGNLD